MLYDFAPRLLRLRKERNLTQQELVDKAKTKDPNLRLTDSVLGKYENAKTIPRLTEAAIIADVLGVSLDYLAEGEKNPNLSLKGLQDEQVELLIELATYMRRKTLQIHHKGMK